MKYERSNFAHSSIQKKTGLAYKKNKRYPLSIASATLLIFAIVLFIIIEMIVDHRRMKKIVIERGKPNICQFARDFDYRSIDTKIIREVWNETQLNLGRFDGEKFPIQSNDRFEETYRIGSESLFKITPPGPVDFRIPFMGIKADKSYGMFSDGGTPAYSKLNLYYGSGLTSPALGSHLLYVFDVFVILVLCVH